MRRFWRFLTGKAVCRTKAVSAEKGMEALLAAGVYAFGLEKQGDDFCFSVSLRDLHRVRRCFAEAKLSLQYTLCGLPASLWRYRRRLGIVAGGALFLFLLLSTGTMVWRVEVQGNVQLQDSQVCTILEEAGVGVGSRISSFQPGIAEKCVARHPELAWMSIRVKGTTVYVTVLEADTPQQSDPEGGVNLIALADGVVEELAVHRGRVLVKAGDTVRKGEILVSGVAPTAHGTVFVAAEGSVRGRVTRTFTREIPLQTEKKIYADPLTGNLLLKFLGFSINISKNTGNLPPTYDTIEKKDSPRLFGKTLPLSRRQTVYLPYTVQPVTLDAETATRYALALLQEQIRVEMGDGTLLEKKTETKVENGVCMVRCTVTYLTELAVAAPFTVEGGERKGT